MVIEEPNVYSFNKHSEYKNPNKLRIECPLRLSVPELGTECIQENCAWWMIIQKACAINVSARIMHQPITK